MRPQFTNWVVLFPVDVQPSPRRRPPPCAPLTPLTLPLASIRSAEARLGIHQSLLAWVGLQCATRPKAKSLDLLGDETDFVVLYNGGAHAGHTIVPVGSASSSFAVAQRHPPPNLRRSRQASSWDPGSCSRRRTRLLAGGIDVGTNLGSQRLTLTSSFPTT